MVSVFPAPLTEDPVPVNEHWLFDTLPAAPGASAADPVPRSGGTTVARRLYCVAQPEYLNYVFSALPKILVFLSAVICFAMNSTYGNTSAHLRAALCRQNNSRAPPGAGVFRATPESR